MNDTFLGGLVKHDYCKLQHKVVFVCMFVFAACASISTSTTLQLQYQWDFNIQLARDIYIRLVAVNI